MEKVKISFLTQYNKIVNAYMQNKLNPLNCTACFVGNLLNNNMEWMFSRALKFGNGQEEGPWKEEQKQRAVACIMQEGGGMYTMSEIVKIENLFLRTMDEGTGDVASKKFWKDSKGYEERLFKAMEVTLEHLKKLHESKGEVIEDNPIFSKRELVEA